MTLGAILGSGELLDAQSAPSEILIDDFEDVGDWSGLEPETAIVHDGEGAGRWSDHLDRTGIRKGFGAPLDLSGMNHVQLWLYSGTANDALVEFVFDSENAEDEQGWDYFRHQLQIDWTGWRYIRIPLDGFHRARRPVGWHRINDVRMSASGWGHEALSDTLLILDELSFGRGVIESVEPKMGYVGRDFVYSYTLSLAEPSGARLELDLVVDVPPSSPCLAHPTDGEVKLDPWERSFYTVELVIPAAAITTGSRLETHGATVRLLTDGRTIDGADLEAAIPLPPREHPRLLLDETDLALIENRLARLPWAADVGQALVEAADSWPDSYLDRYALPAWDLPAEGGQWGLWYVCPTHGVRLRYEAPDRHVCPVDGEVFTGWPYDQVVMGWMHRDLAAAARDLALAYRLTGEARYGTEAAEILLRYAAAYNGYPLHGVSGEPTGSGARVLSQTLDESIWLIPMAWTYDLLADTPALSPTDAEAVARGLLRPAAALIGANRAGVSNWQSWHNAAVGAVGFTLEDPRLISQAIRAPKSGFDYQMKESVTGDGFWYEGSWGYHFFALDAHVYLAESAERAGLALYARPELESMFAAPLQFAMPDQTLPPFNDSGTTNLLTQDDNYEVGYARYGDEAYLSVLGRRPRGRTALLWGADEVFREAPPQLGSALFPDAGYAVLRVAHPDAPMYLALDFGPHGGGHGHYDKLGFVFHAMDQLMGIDPGTQSYAAPTHSTWDKETVAHNTVVLDERSQAAATGRLHRFVALPDLAAVAADAGAAYPGANLHRTIVLSDLYAIDRFRVSARDGQRHTFDWLYHNDGELTPGSVLEGAIEGGIELPSQNGYQHITDRRAGTIDQDWEARFDIPSRVGEDYGSVWANEAAIEARFTFSDERAATGAGSGRLSYDFSSAPGYILYGTERPIEKQEVPETLTLALYGDGSGHGLSLRVYDSTNERFVSRLGAIDWTGWRAITVTGIADWSHYLGNDDGVFDPPAASAAIQLSHQDGGPAAGRLYADDIRLCYPDAGCDTVADFEHRRRGVRVRMLGEPGTTVVLGSGLGPDLLKSIPLVMARRSSRTTSFVSLLEPIGEAPVVTEFRQLTTDSPEEHHAAAFVVGGPAAIDSLLFVADGPPETRSFGTTECDGTLCLVRRARDGSPERLVLANGQHLADDGQLLLSGEEPGVTCQVGYHAEGEELRLEPSPEARVAVFGPRVTRVFVAGEPASFSRSGDYVLVPPHHPIYLPLATRGNPASH